MAVQPVSTLSAEPYPELPPALDSYFQHDTRVKAVSRSSFGGGGGKSMRSTRSSRNGDVVENMITPRLNWSGKLMSNTDSKKFFHLLHANDNGEAVEEKVAEALPELFALPDNDVNDSDDEENQAEQSRAASLVMHN